MNTLGQDIDFGFKFEVSKNIKAGSGLGSSASSSSAAVFGVNQLLGAPFTKKELIPFAMEGERAASGSAHADNVAPCLLGGFTLVRSYNPLDIISLDYPDSLYVSVVHPQIEIKTSDSKKIIKQEIPLSDAIIQLGNLGGLVAGLAQSDYDLISRSLKDVIAEPARSMLIPLFKEAKKIAINEGALGGSISGSGPFIFALSTSKNVAQKIATSLDKLHNEWYACTCIFFKYKYQRYRSNFMNYYSTNHQVNPVNFEEAIFRGLPADHGLYMPERIPSLSSSFISSLPTMSLPEMGYEILKHFVDGEIPNDALKLIIEDTLSFDIPLSEIKGGVYALELFHGPTLAFKDVSARFLARCLSYFTRKNEKQLTVLVATSGDTGSAVANGFYNIPGVIVIILYPKEK